MLNLDELETIARAATPGPWNYSPTVLGLTNTTVTADDGEHVAYSAVCHAAPSNAGHIAAFDPPTVLALIAELRVLREANSAEGQAIARATVHAATVIGGLRLYVGSEMVRFGCEGLRAKLREAENVIAKVLDYDGPEAADMRDIALAYKPTNQEGSTEQ